MVSANDTSSSSSSSSSSPGTVDRQTAANRRNAGKSTGPRTAAGKARSRMNAVRHGLCATIAVLPGDDGATFEAFADGIYASFKPRDAAEALLIDQYVSIGWRLRRIGDAEAALHEDEDRRQLRSAAFDYALNVLKHEKPISSRSTKAGEQKEVTPRPEAVDPQSLELPSDQWPRQSTGGEMLAKELRKGEGPVLRLMAQEDRLRRTLTHTVRQIKELRALRKSMEEDPDTDDEPAARPVWERRRSTCFDVKPFRADGGLSEAEINQMLGKVVAWQDEANEEAGQETDAETACAAATVNVRNEPISAVETEAQVAVDASVPIEQDIVRNEPISAGESDAKQSSRSTHSLPPARAPVGRSHF